MIRSLRWQILVSIACGVTAVLLGSCLAITGLMSRSLHEQFDRSLVSRLRALAQMIERSDEGIEIEFVERPLHEFTRAQAPDFYQLWQTTGSELARSEHLVGDLPSQSGSLDVPTLTDLVFEDGRAGRAAVASFLPYVDEDYLPEAGGCQEVISSVTLAVATTTTEVDSTLADLTRVAIAVCIASAAALLGLLAWLVSARLRPLNELASRIATVDPDNPGASIDLTGTPTELTPVVARLNQLLAEIRDVLARERRVTDDIAHEMRTPLSGLRTTIEVALTRSREASDYREALAQCATVCVDTQRVIDTMLCLARGDASSNGLARRVFELSDLVRRTWTPFAARTESRVRELKLIESNPVQLHTDEQKLRIVLTNLFDNASTYADDDGRVLVHWGSRHNQAYVTVSNTGCDLATGDLEKVTERFWRADSARNATGIHAGLGLSLCKCVVEELGGQLELEVNEGQFVATVRLDAAVP